jgi:hypothetical protein
MVDWIPRWYVNLSSDTAKTTVYIPRLSRQDEAVEEVLIRPMAFYLHLDRFYRADPSRSEAEGSGFGLAIAKWIADLHHAKTDVSSHRGLGSSFTLRFKI